MTRTGDVVGASHAFCGQILFGVIDTWEEGDDLDRVAGVAV